MPSDDVSLREDEEPLEADALDLSLAPAPEEETPAASRTPPRRKG